jgi:arsenite-transporting ATPase
VLRDYTNIIWKLVSGHKFSESGEKLRIILYTGKGGVGKTSMSAATAVHISEMGYKTIVLSTDMAHSLSDSFDVDIGYGLKRIEKNLWAQEINVTKELMKNWGALQEFVIKFLKYQGFEDVMAEEFSIFPGMEELFSLLKLMDYVEEQKYDVAIIDCAPTASTIRMLSFPDILEWYMSRLFHIERKLMKAVRPVAKRVTKMPLPQDEVYSSIEELYYRIDSLKDILSDSKTSTTRIVMNPEKMVIKESQRVYTYLSLFGLSVDCIIMNRIIPDGVQDAHFKRWKTVQKKHMELAQECFSPLPIFEVGLQDTEVVGVKLLKKLARSTFGKKDPTRVFFTGKPMEISEEGDEYVIKLMLPFASKKDAEVWVKGEEIIISLGSFRRNIFLPRSLVGLAIKEAKLTGGYLKIRFTGSEEGGESE